MDQLNPEGDVEEWLERFQCWVDVQDAVIAAAEDAEKLDARKVAFLLSCIGPDGYKILKAYAAPENPRSLKFDD